jgi:hypothetical protein
MMQEEKVQAPQLSLDFKQTMSMADMLVEYGKRRNCIGEDATYALASGIGRAKLPVADAIQLATAASKLKMEYNYKHKEDS